jgi:hypothetical protein
MVRRRRPFVLLVKAACRWGRKWNDTDRGNRCAWRKKPVPMLLCLPPNLTWVEAGPPPWEADDWTPATCHGLPTSDNVDQLYKPVKYVFIPNTICHLPAHLKARHNKIIHVYVTWEKWVVGGQRLVSVSCIWLRRIITAIRDLRFSSWYYSLKAKVQGRLGCYTA